ncbi:paired amphipathic helix protein Sin3b [Annulohypoxylon moriforme]|nr:paired amphipathic helix protein Sin3b [Annulohypoxylon moriforme]
MNSHPEDMSHRDRESVERHQREQFPAGTPRQSNTASLQIHQPVASRLPGAIHSPGGLLATHGGSGPPIPLGAPSGPVNTFGGPLQADSNRSIPHNAQNASNQMFGAIGGHNQNPSGSSAPSNHLFGGPLQQDGNRASQNIPFGSSNGAIPGGAHPIPSGGNAGGMPQGQQPILNDALSYLDQVKVQFADQPDVYNKFLDIMKDFKSQTIDTPGVINRVSELFAGHPNLIQGFNTFLPPGYRIECGAGNDPNTIRVTTPMGTTVQSITGRANQGDGAHGQPGTNGPFFNHRGNNWPQHPQPQHSIESPEASFSAPVANGPNLFAAAQAQGSNFEGQAPASQQHRSTPQVQNNSTTPNAPTTRNALTPTPSNSQGGPSNGNQQANMEKRGPVEFNHAISYVNKIKNRFQDKPEIYKQFLEILQTYQREQKPIQDVYAQVTTLFNTAPDLLEDFKQFLPESAASNKANGPKPEDVFAMTAGLTQTTPQPNHSVRDGQKMPPVGAFAPPASASKDNRKRPRNDKQAPPPAAAMADSPAPGARSIPGVGPASKRPKLNHKPLPTDAPSIEPTLTPILPEPLPPTSSANATPDELGFFEKVKKYIGNRSTMNEFLKLCNMYSQSLIDTNDLVHKASQFIGGNNELMTWFKGFVGYEGVDEIIENRPRPPVEKVSLSNCRAIGPSYRLLPRREKLKPCGGRDEMCNAVLNDEWASHPTWASEDSGFVAHRKNAFEEGLHRIEEERHDYDFNIEANVKCIQLLEPIAQQMLNLTVQERETFQMPPGLGGSSTSIFKRVLKKIYGNEKGLDVVADMFSDPFAVVPVVLARLKQKDEEWRFTQREWEKVWQAQTEIMHLKSLDHMGIQVKQNDKRNLSAKHLVDVIKTKHEEQRRLRSSKNAVPRYQFAYELGDREVILDLLRFMVLYGTNNGHHSATEKERIVDFFEFFIPQFFELPEDKVQDRLHDIDRESGEEDAEEQLPAELTNGRSRRNGKKSDLLRGVLDPGRNGTKTRNQKEDSAASGSKETTPDANSANEEEMADAPDDPVPTEQSNERWLPVVPRATVVKGENPLVDGEGELKADGFFPRPWYNLFCNQTIFVFFTVFQTLYKRLKAVKDSKNSVSEEIIRSKSKKPAKELGISINEINYFDENDPASFWPKTVELIEDYITGEIDENRYQEVLRHYYLKKGWTLYTIQDLLRTLCRLSLTCTSPDSKEKTPDLINHFLNSRHNEETSYQTEISARKYAEKCIKDGDMFVICWFPQKHEATVRWLQRDETTFYMDEMELRERWQYYISSYMRVEPTEGVPRARLQKTVLARNLPSSEPDSDDSDMPKPLAYDEGLVLRICLNSNKIVWEKNTSEYFIYATEPEDEKEKIAADEYRRALTEHREQRFREKMIMNNSWMHGNSQDEVQKVNEKFQKWFKDGISPNTNGRGDDAENTEGVE